jgi:hypothetical protein
MLNGSESSWYLTKFIQTLPDDLNWQHHEQKVFAELHHSCEHTHRLYAQHIDLVTVLEVQSLRKYPHELFSSTVDPDVWRRKLAYRGRHINDAAPVLTPAHFG